MTVKAMSAVDILNRQFFLDYPIEAARRLEAIPAQDVIEATAHQPAPILALVWRQLLPDVGANLLLLLPDPIAHGIIAELPPHQVVRMLGYIKPEKRQTLLDSLDASIQTDIQELLSYPDHTAGRIMNTGVVAFRQDALVGNVLTTLRKNGMKTARSLFLVDDEHRLVGRVTLQDAALANLKTPLSTLIQPLPAVVQAIDTLEQVSEIFMRGDILDVPVVDHDGIFLGAVTNDELSVTVRADATVNMQTMVGASKSEKALSSPFFAIRSRLPWLQINLLTAFMAAAVVGLFEATIAQVTALAVLLPVVAGQSGNTGAQALAVTMRGLALREITVRQWSKVMRKEVIAGLLNGVAVAITCGIGVFIWSQSFGLVAVIMSSMVLAMIAAGFAGGIIPIILTRFGQDPATSSSIILTTVTDIAGFFAFLGIATLMMQFL